MMMAALWATAGVSHRTMKDGHALSTRIGAENGVKPSRSIEAHHLQAGRSATATQDWQDRRRRTELPVSPSRTCMSDKASHSTGSYAVLVLMDAICRPASFARSIS